MCMEGRDRVARTPKKAKAKAKASKPAARRPRRSKSRAASEAATTPDGATALHASRGVPMPASGYRAKIRMYRQGLGDCFLIGLPRTGRSNRPFYLMIDCGVVLGTPAAADTMKVVLDHIVESTDKKIDLLIATHEH